MFSISKPIAPIGPSGFSAEFLGDELEAPTSPKSSSVVSGEQVNLEDVLPRDIVRKEVQLMGLWCGSVPYLVEPNNGVVVYGSG